MSSRILLLFFFLSCLSGCSVVDYYRAQINFAFNNDEDAVELLTSSAEAGNSDAQLALGSFYKTGESFKKDYKKSVYWYQKAADQNNVDAIRNLGYMFEKGYGLKKDIKKALKLYQQASDLNDPEAMANIGILYSKGSGVHQSTVDAMLYFERSASLGHAPSMRYLAEYYEEGVVFKVDYNKALELYKESNTKVAQRRYKDLKSRMKCLGDDVTRLFNLSIKCSKREDMRESLRLTKAKFVRQHGLSDIYSSSLLLKESSQLKIDYDGHLNFIQATYTFPSRMDIGQVARILELVESKYGKPSLSEGQANVGSVNYKWILKDGIEILVRRGWPETTTYMSYRYPELHDELAMIREKQMNRLKVKEYQSQNNAF